ncbi:hypothetical protein B0H13DRAFT_2330262 [Mycena leptocephala]|nr:hypothetical protein B0H13DRAFT_2330262 [Mycena leptocephala]
MVSWSDLSHCHNTDCNFRGSCRKFFPADGVPMDGAEALGMRCVCGCYGFQHYEPASAPPPPTSSKPAPPGPSAPSQSPPKASGSFVDAARLRKERQMGHIHAQSYDPSSKIMSNPRPKDDGASKRAAIGAAVSSASIKPPAMIKFTFVLVEKPKLVDEGNYRMPDSGKMTSLYRCGHIKPSNSRPRQRPRTSKSLLRQNTLLFPRSWRDETAGGFDLQDLEWSVQNHRQERVYKRLIFISPSRWSASLKLDIDDDSDEGFSEEFSDSDNAEPASEPVDQEFPAHTGNDSPEEPSASKPTPSTITQLHRLTVNIWQPKSEAWWPLNIPDLYVRAFNALPQIVRLLERLESSGGSTSWSPALVFDLAADELFPELKFIVSFADSDDADYASRFLDYIRLGPHGLQPFIDLLYGLYNVTINWTPRLSDPDLALLIAIIDTFATPIYAGLLHLRTSVPRYTYDPPGFAELQEVLQKSRHRFGEADIADRLSVFDLLVGHDGVAAFATSLEADFGSITSARLIRASSLLVGPHGIDGFLEKIVIPLLDSMPTDDPSYIPLRALLGTFCGELAIKIANHTKTQGKKKRNDTGDAGGGKDGGSGGGYETRSKKSGGQGAQFNTPVPDDKPTPANDHTSADPKPMDLSDDDTLSDGSIHEFEPTNKDRQKFARARDEHAPDDDNSEGTSSRPRFPYPETRPQRERPYDRPPPPSTPRPKPRPAYTGSGFHAKPRPSASTSAAAVSEGVVTGTEHLANISTRRELVETILNDFPHPVAERRLLWNTISHRPSNRRLWHRVVLVYHPDKNCDMPVEWRKKCDVITKILNNKFN